MTILQNLNAKKDAFFRLKNSALLNKASHFIQAYKTVIFGIALISFSAFAQAPLDIRIALIIGNSKYADFPRLANPGNDAKAMSAVLTRLGFKVINVNDGTKEQMTAAITQMQDALKGQQAVAMLYYAGHGLQLNWRNYMVAVNSQIDKTDDIPKQTIDVDRVLQAFKNAGTRMNIIVLDACRDNPFEAKASGKGLSQIDAPPNTYISFATAPGNVAQDGDPKAGNGLFTQYILKELQRPAPVEDMFKRVRLQVRKASNGAQIPWDSSSLEVDFAFNDGEKHTFKPEDLAKDLQLAKENEEQLKQQLAQAKEQEKKLAEQRAEEERKLAQIKQMKDQAERAKAEQAAKEREKQIQLAQEQEKQKALAAQQAIEQAKLAEEQQRKDLAQAKAKEAEGVKQFKALKKEDKDTAFAKEKADWDKIKDSTNANDFYAYLDKYPNGLITEQATFRLNQLAMAKITVQPGKDGILQKPGEKRYRVGDSWEYVVKDNFTGNIVRQEATSVEKIENGLVYFSGKLGQVRTEDGATVRVVISTGAVMTLDPPEPWQPGGDFQVGQKWESESIQTINSPNFSPRKRYSSAKVVGIEVLKIGGQEVKTFKVDIVTNTGQDTLNLQFWFEPGWGTPLKIVQQIKSGSRPVAWETIEVISRKRGAG